MRRALVLNDEVARHPFLKSLPPHVRQQAPEPAKANAWRITAGDVRDFLLAYCACFVCVSAFIG